jgi:uncharacterized protein YuzE
LHRAELLFSIYLLLEHNNSEYSRAETALDTYRAGYGHSISPELHEAGARLFCAGRNSSGRSDGRGPLARHRDLPGIDIMAPATDRVCRRPKGAAAMKTTYDAEADALYVRFSETPVVESEEVSDGVVLDFDAEGRIVAIELLDASKHLAAGAKLPTAAE